MFLLFLMGLFLLRAAAALNRGLEHTPPDHDLTEFHKGDCMKFEKSVIESAFKTTTSGTVLIIGAHNHENDFWKYLSSASNLEKVFVEPLIPSQFHDFEQDTKKLKKATVVNAAVTTEDADNVTIYCTGSKHPEHIVFKTAGGHRQLKVDYTLPINIVQTCSLSKERLFAIHNLDLGGHGVATKLEKKDVEKHMTEHKVKTISLKTLLKTRLKTPLRMLQIDVEGLDDKIITELPLEEMTENQERPHVILFEHALLKREDYRRAMKHMHDNFYITCAVNHNIFAYDVQWYQTLNAPFGGVPPPPNTN